MLDEEEHKRAQAWFEDIFHDLVKYLEMMPRSLDWEALEEDDWDILWESIMETRMGRAGTQSVEMIWDAARQDLGEALYAKIPGLDDAARCVAETMQAAHRIEAGEDVDASTLHTSLFGIGNALRTSRAHILGD